MSVSIVHSFSLMPLGLIVLSTRIQLSSSRRRVFLFFAVLSTAVTIIWLGCTSWSVKCFATGVFLLNRMSALCSFILVSNFLPVSPTYCKWHAGHVMMYMIDVDWQVLFPIMLCFFPVVLELMY